MTTDNTHQSTTYQALVDSLAEAFSFVMAHAPMDSDRISIGIDSVTWRPDETEEFRDRFEARVTVSAPLEFVSEEEL